MVEPGVIARGPDCFTISHVGPFLSLGAVELFNFPVGLGTMGASQSIIDMPIPIPMPIELSGGDELKWSSLPGVHRALESRAVPDHSIPDRPDTECSRRKSVRSVDAQPVSTWVKELEPSPARVLVGRDRDGSTRFFYRFDRCVQIN